MAFVPWEALSCLALTLKLCRPIVPSADCTTSVAGVYLAKRRTANHPCPVCGKHYVNEGSLRKHLACHPETSQLSTSLRMWPCSVCQAVFTHESGKYSPFNETNVQSTVVVIYMPILYTPLYFSFFHGSRGIAVRSFRFGRGLHCRPTSVTVSPTTDPRNRPKNALSRSHLLCC